MQNERKTYKEASMPNTEEQLKKFIKDYLKENLKVSVWTDFCYDADAKKIGVTLWMGDEEISSSTEYL